MGTDRGYRSAAVPDPDAMVPAGGQRPDPGRGTGLPDRAALRVPRGGPEAVMFYWLSRYRIAAALIAAILLSVVAGAFGVGTVPLREPRSEVDGASYPPPPTVTMWVTETVTSSPQAPVSSPGAPAPGPTPSPTPTLAEPTTVAPYPTGAPPEPTPTVSPQPRNKAHGLKDACQVLRHWLLRVPCHVLERMSAKD